MPTENRANKAPKDAQRKQDPDGQTAKDDGISRDDIEAGNDMNPSTRAIDRDGERDAGSRKER